MMNISGSQSGSNTFYYQSKPIHHGDNDGHSSCSTRSRNSRMATKGNVRSRSVDIFRGEKHVLNNDHEISDQIKALGLTADVGHPPNKYDPHWLDSCNKKGIDSLLTVNSETTSENNVGKTSIEREDEAKGHSYTVIHDSDHLNKTLFRRNSDGLSLKPSRKVMVPNTNTECFVHTVDYRPELVECQCNHQDKTDLENFKGTKKSLKRTEDEIDDHILDVRKYFPSHDDHFFRSKDDFCKDLSCIGCLLKSFRTLKRASSDTCLHNIQRNITLFRDAPNQEETQENESSKETQDIDEKRTSNDNLGGQWTILKSPLDRHKSETGGVLSKHKREKRQRRGMFSDEHSDSDDTDLEHDFEMWNPLGKIPTGWMSTKIPVSKRENNLFSPVSY